MSAPRFEGYRRLRHLRQVAARGLFHGYPLPHSTTSYSIQCQDQVLYESESIESCNPTWTSMPPFDDLWGSKTSITVTISREVRGEKKGIIKIHMDLPAVEYLCTSMRALPGVLKMASRARAPSALCVLLLRFHDGVFAPSAEYSTFEAFETPVSTMECDWDAVDFEDRAEKRDGEGLALKTSLSTGDIGVLATASETLRVTCSLLQAQREHQQTILRDHFQQCESSAIETAQTNVSGLLQASINDSRTQMDSRCQSLRQEIEKAQARIESSRNNAAAFREKRRAIEASSTTTNEQHSIDDRDFLERLKHLCGRLNVCYPLSLFKHEVAGVPLPEAKGYPEIEAHAVALGHVCHILDVFTRVFACCLPHPIVLRGNRSSIVEREGGRPIDLFVNSSEREFQKRGYELLRRNVVYMIVLSVAHERQPAVQQPLVVLLDILLNR